MLHELRSLAGLKSWESAPDFLSIIVCREAWGVPEKKRQPNSQNGWKRDTYPVHAAMAREFSVLDVSSHG